MAEIDPMSVRQSAGISRIEVWQCSFTWVIENVNFCPKKCGDAIESPPFTSGPRNELKWRLELMPRGSSPDSDDNVALFLKLLSSTSGSTFARYEVSLWTDAKKRRSLSRTDLFRPCGKFGWQAFVKSSYFFKEYDSFQAVTVRCEISAAERVNWATADLTSVNFIAPYRPTAGPLLSLLESGRFSDVSMMACDGKEFKVHVAILAAYSDKCFAIFQQWDATKRKKNLLLDMRAYDSSTVQQVLDFVYGGKLPDFTDTQAAEYILSAANELGIEALKRVCEQVLETRITLTSVSNLLLLADVHDAKRLKRKCLSFTRENVAQVLDTASWKSLMCHRPNLLADVTKEISLALLASTS